MYSEKIMDDLVNKMVEFLNCHETYKLMELVASAIATKEEPQNAELRNTVWFCPNCKNPVEQFNFGEFNNYCAFCGQRLIF